MRIIFFLSFILGNFVLAVSQHSINAEEIYLKNKYEDSVKIFQKQLEKDSKSARTHNNLACALFQLNQKEEALKHWLLALENSSDPMYLARINYNIGNHYYKANERDKAIESYKKALRLNPDDRLAKYNLEVAIKENPPPPPQNNSNSPNNNQNNDNNPPPQEDNKSNSKSNKQPQMSRDEAERLLNALQKGERGPKRQTNNSSSSSTGRDW